jgi:uncharacterized protein (TIGR02246 family)
MRTAQSAQQSWLANRLSKTISMPPHPRTLPRHAAQARDKKGSPNSPQELPNGVQLELHPSGIKGDLLMRSPLTTLSFVAAALSALLQSGCMQAPPATPVPTTHTDDEKAIRDTEAAWVKAFATKGPEKAAAFYADDAASMLPDTPLMTGRAAIIAGMKPELGDPNFSLVFAPTKIVIASAGDIAYSQGTFHYTTTDPKTKKRVGQSGNYVEVYKKQADGTWKVEEDIATEETPLKALKPGE